MAGTVYLFRSGSGDYESVKPTGYTQILALFSIIEREWARTGGSGSLTVVIVASGSMDSIHIQGRGFIGI